MAMLQECVCLFGLLILLSQQNLLRAQKFLEIVTIQNPNVKELTVIRLDIDDKDIEHY